MEVEVEEPWLHELKVCVDAMRMWTPPSQDLISPIRTGLRSSRVPDHVMGAFDNHKGLYDHLFYPVSDHAFKSEADFQKTLEIANRLRQHSYTTKFTHGDFKAHNILVSDGGHLAGLLDWESGGWYPEYWEFTTAMRFGKDSWWYQVAPWMGGDQTSRSWKLIRLSSPTCVPCSLGDSQQFMLAIWY